MDNLLLRNHHCEEATLPQACHRPHPVKRRENVLFVSGRCSARCTRLLYATKSWAASNRMGRVGIDCRLGGMGAMCGAPSKAKDCHVSVLVSSHSSLTSPTVCPAAAMSRDAMPWLRRPASDKTFACSAQRWAMAAARSRASSSNAADSGLSQSCATFDASSPHSDKQSYTLCRQPVPRPASE